MEANLAQALDNFALHCTRKGDNAGARELSEREREISERLELKTSAKSPYFGVGR
ncbi:MAG: hypothetical protein IPM63_18735 [Acidobacteriota bacterium]|nr:MAG: hypothetical protein IPM63_18735 [Acidobacteriota bacterium]